MARDRSLDEFLDAGDADTEDAGAGDADIEDADTGDADIEDADAGDGTVTGSGGTAASGGRNVEPAEPTYEWAPGPRACARCGARVARRWRADAEDDGGSAMVCSDCKNW